MTGSPTGSPVASAAAGGQLAEPAGRRRRAPAARPRSTGATVHFQSPSSAQRTALEVERQVADLGRGRIDEAAGQAMGQERRQQQVVADRGPRVRLVGAEPVRLAVGHEAGDGVAQAERPEARVPSRRRRTAGPPCAAGRARRSPGAAAPGRVGHDDRAALRRDGQPGDRVAPHGRIGEDPPAGLADRAPVQLGVLLGPAGLGRDVRLDRDPRRMATSVAGRRRTRARGRSASRHRWRRIRSVDGGRHGAAVLEQDARRHDARPGRSVRMSGARSPPSRAVPSRRPGTARGRCRPRAGG